MGIIGAGRQRHFHDDDCAYFLNVIKKRHNKLIFISPEKRNYLFVKQEFYKKKLPISNGQNYFSSRQAVWALFLKRLYTGRWELSGLFYTCVYCIMHIALLLWNAKCKQLIDNWQANYCLSDKHFNRKDRLTQRLIKKALQTLR